MIIPKKNTKAGGEQTHFVRKHNTNTIQNTHQKKEKKHDNYEKHKNRC